MLPLPSHEAKFRRVNIRDFMRGLSPEQKIQFAEKAGTTRDHLWQISGGHRKAGTELARNLVEASIEMFPNAPESHLTLWEVRPDIWQEADFVKEPKAAIGAS